MLVPLNRAVEEEEESTTALKKIAMASVDWHPRHRTPPMEATTHPATARGTTHRIYIGKEEEEEHTPFSS